MDPQRRAPRRGGARSSQARGSAQRCPKTWRVASPKNSRSFCWYCHSLSFAQKPDYAYWRERFRDLAKDLGYKDTDRFVWPVPLAQPSKSRSHLNQRTEAQLKLAEAQLQIKGDHIGRPVLGDKKNVQGGGGNGRDLLLKKPGRAEVVVISDGESSGEYGPVHRHNKAAHITKLTQAADNRVLARLTEDFVKVLRNSNSRTLTREGFGFLDALHKQLADPSMFIVPPRSSKTRSSRSQRDQESAAAAEDAPHERRSRLYGLCASLKGAQDTRRSRGWWLNSGR
ncbi:hypothetical protein EDB85DRAFT_1241423 [Lactarius pseudohatsudake]|nr:hypothetical protein EDB85DRAFT_1241423 [Lactarius pseudohatsudake]